MKDDGDNACVYWLGFKDALVRKLGLNSRCEASLAKLAKDVVKPNLTYLRFKVMKVKQMGKRLKLESKDLKYVDYA
uniref:Uncharacterized protein n=1 Tax=Tanacetum cinerariifolium TaxID=118510 RepID=A0A6L2M9I3_TANCI|nr:hypothetical protein [Tanacetum cinerariifolium]